MILAFFLIVAALAGVLLLWLWVASRREDTLPAHRRRPVDPRTDGSAVSSVATVVTDTMSKLVRGRESALAESLGLAGIRLRPVDFLVWSLVACMVLGAVGALLGGFIGVVLGTLLAFTGTQGWVWWGTRRRRKKFDGQMLETFQTIAGGLRAGQSLGAAVAMVAEESDYPMAEEFSRAVMEARIGADLVASLQAVANRTRSDSMGWLVKTVAINQEVGGSLANAMDGAVETITARIELDGKVKALAAEGKLSAYILMALPFLVAIVVNIFTPGYLLPLVTHWVGWVILGSCAVQFLIGGLWIKKIITIKY